MVVILYCVVKTLNGYYSQTDEIELEIVPQDS